MKMQKYGWGLAVLLAWCTGAAAVEFQEPVNIGTNNVVTGTYSFAQGANNQATGQYSSAQGSYA